MHAIARDRASASDAVRMPAGRVALRAVVHTHTRTHVQFGVRDPAPISTGAGRQDGGTSAYAGVGGCRDTHGENGVVPVALVHGGRRCAFCGTARFVRFGDACGRRPRAHTLINPSMERAKCIHVCLAHLGDGGGDRACIRERAQCIHASRTQPRLGGSSGNDGRITPSGRRERPHERSSPRRVSAAARRWVPSSSSPSISPSNPSPCRQTKRSKRAWIPTNRFSSSPSP